jgi:hypothetical protein
MIWYRNCHLKQQLDKPHKSLFFIQKLSNSIDNLNSKWMKDRWKLIIQISLFKSHLRNRLHSHTQKKNRQIIKICILGMCFFLWKIWERKLKSTFSHVSGRLAGCWWLRLAIFGDDAHFQNNVAVKGRLPAEKPKKKNWNIKRDDVTRNYPHTHTHKLKI